MSISNKEKIIRATKNRGGFSVNIKVLTSELGVEGVGFLAYLMDKTSYYESIGRSNFFISESDMEEETLMKRRIQNKNIKLLVEKGLINKWVHGSGSSARRYFDVYWDKVTAAIDDRWKEMEQEKKDRMNDVQIVHDSNDSDVQNGVSDVHSDVSDVHSDVSDVQNVQLSKSITKSINKSITKSKEKTEDTGVDKRYTDIFNQYPANRKGNFKTSMSKFNKLTEEEKDRASNAAELYIEENKKEGYKYVCHINKYFDDKKWTTVVDVNDPATHFTPEQIKGYEEIGMVYFPAEEGPGRFDFPVVEKEISYDMFG